MSSMNFVSYQEAFRYITESRYPDGSSDSRKRAIRKFVKSKVMLEAGVLYYRGEEESKRQWIADPDQQKQILASVHDDPAGGCHFGRDKTRDKVCKGYYWHNMVEEIDAYVHTCKQCQKVGNLNYGLFMRGTVVRGRFGAAVVLQQLCSPL